MYQSALMLIRFSGICAAFAALMVDNTIKKFSRQELLPVLQFLIIAVGAVIIAFYAYTTYSSSERTEEQQKEIKMNAAIMGIITGICFLISIF